MDQQLRVDWKNKNDQEKEKIMRSVWRKLKKTVSTYVMHLFKILISMRETKLKWNTQNALFRNDLPPLVSWRVRNYISRATVFHFAWVTLCPLHFCPIHLHLLKSHSIVSIRLNFFHSPFMHTQKATLLKTQFKLSSFSHWSYLNLFPCFIYRLR